MFDAVGGAYALLSVCRRSMSLPQAFRTASCRFKKALVMLTKHDSNNDMGTRAYSESYVIQAVLDPIGRRTPNTCTGGHVLEYDLPNLLS
jgi:hypothetical protein